MKTSVLLRTASIVALLFAVGHTMGHPWTLGPAPVIDAMKSYHFNAMGSDRTYWDFYLGFGVSLSVYMFAQAVVLWMLAGLAKAQPAVVRPFVAVFLAANAVNGVIAWMYLFLVPLVLTVALVLCLLLAWIASGRREGA